jgi:hypothetical protein
MGESDALGSEKVVMKDLYTNSQEHLFGRVQADRPADPTAGHAVPSSRSRPGDAFRGLYVSEGDVGTLLANRLRVSKISVTYCDIWRKMIHKFDFPSGTRGYCTRSARAKHAVTTPMPVPHSAAEFNAFIGRYVFGMQVLAYTVSHVRSFCVI